MVKKFSQGKLALTDSLFCHEVDHLQNKAVCDTLKKCQR
jgi:hypothetical protein